MTYRPDEPQDDVDQIFAQLRKAAPPADLTQRIMRALPTTLPAPVVATPAAAPLPSAASRRRWQWAAAIAGIAFAIMSVRLGVALDDVGVLDLLGQTFGNAGTFWSAPGDFVGALVETLPWVEVILTLATFAVFWYSAAALVGRPPQLRQE